MIGTRSEPDGTPGLAITRAFAAPPAAVFAAWTERAQFAVWFGGDQGRVPLDRLTYRAEAGRGWSGVMVLPDGTELVWGGEFVEVDPPERLVLTLTDDPTRPERELLTVSLTATGGGTAMRVTQTGGHLTEHQYAQTAIGYGTFFDVMERLLAVADAPAVPGG